MKQQGAKRPSERELDKAWSAYANFIDGADLRDLFRVGGGDWSLLPKSALWLVEICQLSGSAIRTDCCRQIVRRGQFGEWGTNTHGNDSSGMAPDWNGTRDLRII